MWGLQPGPGGLQLGPGGESVGVATRARGTATRAGVESVGLQLCPGSMGVEGTYDELEKCMLGLLKCVSGA